MKKSINNIMESLNFKEWIEYSNVSNENKETKIMN